MDEFRKNKRYCPEESIMEIGDRNNPVERRLACEIILKQIIWEQETFPQVKLLDFAFHFDEPNANDHVHQRRVWTAVDHEGNLYVSQNDSLKQMGIERPDPSKPEGRHNNAKMTYSKMCREHFIELCR